MRYELPKQRSATNRGASPSVPWPYLITMWRNPTMVAWFIIAFVLLFVARLPFARLGMVPYFVEFHPGFVLLPILAVCWGPAAAWAALAAGIAGDALLGYWESVSFFRAVGWMVAVLCTQHLYSATNIQKEESTVSAMLKFMAMSIPACCAAAVWPAIQAGFLRYYPYCYIVTLSFLNNLVFLILFGPGLFRFLVHHTHGDVCLWQRYVSRVGSTLPVTRFPRILIWVGSLGSLVMGLLVSGLVYDAWPWSLYLIGTLTGAWVRIVVAFFLIVLLIGLCWPVTFNKRARMHTISKIGSRKSSSFRDLYLPS